MLTWHPQTSIKTLGELCGKSIPHSNGGLHRWIRLQPRNGGGKRLLWNGILSAIGWLCCLCGQLYRAVFAVASSGVGASDKFGRRHSILVACLVQIVNTHAAAASVNYIVHFFRFLLRSPFTGVSSADLCSSPRSYPQNRDSTGKSTSFRSAMEPFPLPFSCLFLHQTGCPSYCHLNSLLAPDIVLLAIPEESKMAYLKQDIGEALDILKDMLRK